MANILLALPLSNVVHLLQPLLEADGHTVTVSNLDIGYLEDNAQIDLLIFDLTYQHSQMTPTQDFLHVLSMKKEFRGETKYLGINARDFTPDTWEEAIRKWPVFHLSVLTVEKMTGLLLETIAELFPSETMHEK